MMSDLTKVTLIYPPKLHQVESQTPNFAHQEAVIYPPLGLLYLAGMFREDASVAVKVLDCQLDFPGVGEFTGQVARDRPDIIGITLMSNLLFDAYEVMRALRERLPGVPIIAGGPHVTLYPGEVLQSGLADFVIAGDGEYGFHKLVNLLKEASGADEAALSEVPGLGYLDGAGRAITIPNSKQETLELDLLPFPDRRLLNHRSYGNPANARGGAASLLTSRGCPFKCVFCDIPHRRYLSRSPERIADEIEEILRLGIDEINIMDDTFNLNRSRVVDLCEEILRRKLKFRWVGRGRVHPFDEQLAKLMKRAGCYRFHVGVETGSEEMLKKIGKKITLAQVRNFFELCQGNGLETLAYFIIGFEGEREGHIRQTIALARELRPTYAFFSILSLFPGSAVYGRAREKGLIEGDPWLEFSKNPSVDFEIPFWTEDLSRERLFELLREAYRRFYFSPRYLGRSLLGALSSPRKALGMARTGLSMLKYLYSRKKGF